MFIIDKLLQKCYNWKQKGKNFMPQIVIGSDHGGYKLKNEIIAHLKASNYDIVDLGCFNEESCDYPIIAKDVANTVLDKNIKGILVCGTGIGMSIAANRFKGIRASHCTDTYTARMTRLHNDSNILCLGQRVTGPGLALDIVDIWLNTEFEGGRHLKRIEML